MNGKTQRPRGIAYIAGDGPASQELICTISGDIPFDDLEGRVRYLASQSGIHLNALYDGFTALQEATCTGNAGLVEIMLIAGGDRDARCAVSRIHGDCRTKVGDTALAMAAGTEVISQVFASGVDYWQRPRHGGHALVMKEVVKTLMLVRQRLDALDALDTNVPAATTDANDARALPHLSEELWIKALGFLRSADFLLVYPLTPGAVINHRNTACLEMLLSEDANANADEVVDPNYAPDPDRAGPGNQVAKVAHYPRSGDTLLARTAREGNVGAVRALVQSGNADVNLMAPNGALPLVLAILSKRNALSSLFRSSKASGIPPCVEILLEAGADINKMDGWGRSALAVAAQRGNTAWFADAHG